MFDKSFISYLCRIYKICTVIYDKNYLKYIQYYDILLVIVVSESGVARI